MLGSVFWDAGFNLKEIGVAAMVLFAVIDIFGTIPMIIALKEKTGKKIVLQKPISPLGIKLLKYL